MEENKTQVKYSNYAFAIIQSILRQWRIIVVVVVFAMLSFDLLKTFTYQPTYSASTVVTLVNNTGKGLGVDDSAKAKSALEYMLNSSYMKDKVNTKLKQEVYRGDITLNLTGDTNLCNIQCISYSQKEVYLNLKTMLDIYSKDASRSSYGYYIQTIDPITFSGYPMNVLSHKSNYMMGCAVSLVLVVGILGIIAYFRDTVKSKEDLSSKIEASLYGSIPKEHKTLNKNIFIKNKSAILVTQFQTGFNYVEAMNKMTNKIIKSAAKHRYKSFMITSTLENEGKSSIAVNLALTLAKNGHKTIIIDADFKKPALHKIFETEPEYNLVDVLDGKVKYTEALITKKHMKVDAICGNYIEDIKNYEESFSKLVRKLEKDYDFVIIDSAPTGVVLDALYLSKHVDGIFMVVKQNEATTQMINDTIYHISNSQGHILGTIYNESIRNPFYRQRVYGSRYNYYRYRGERRKS